MAAILFPVFAQARERARRTACLSNLKQIGLACLQYSQDYDEKLVPSYMYRYGLGDARDYWQTALEPYMKSQQILQCPSATPFASYTGPSYMMTATGYHPGSTVIPPSSIIDIYHPNGCSGPCTKLVSQAQAARPSESIVLLERSYCDTHACSADAVLTGGAWYDWSTYPWKANYPGRHQGGHNCLFVDGHAKWKKEDSFRGREFVLNESPEAGWTGW